MHHHSYSRARLAFDDYSDSPSHAVHFDASAPPVHTVPLETAFPLLASCGSDGRVCVWRLLDAGQPGYAAAAQSAAADTFVHQLVCTVTRADGGAYTGARWSPKNASLVALVHADGVDLLDVAAALGDAAWLRGACERRIAIGTEAEVAATTAAGGADVTVALGGNGAAALRLECAQRGVSDAAFSYSGFSLAVAGRCGRVAVYACAPHNALPWAQLMHVCEPFAAPATTTAAAEAAAAGVRHVFFAARTDAVLVCVDETRTRVCTMARLPRKYRVFSSGQPVVDQLFFFFFNCLVFPVV